MSCRSIHDTEIRGNGASSLHWENYGYGGDVRAPLVKMEVIHAGVDQKSEKQRVTVGNLFSCIGKSS